MSAVDRFREVTLPKNDLTLPALQVNSPAVVEFVIHGLARQASSVSSGHIEEVSIRVAPPLAAIARVGNEHRLCPRT
jgi:hypothetical protein